MTEAFEEPGCVKKYMEKMKKIAQNQCSTKTLKKRLPILQWLPTYTFSTFILDVIAGVTVGLTAIPQGLAYAAVAGLPPAYGLYSGLTGGLIYMFFGGCKEVSIGPTAILSALVARNIVADNADFAVLTAFLAGIIELCIGILHLGFLVQYISKPVISGFTNAACFQIITSQFKSLFGHSGPSGHYFAESVASFIKFVSTTNVSDITLGFLTIIVIVLLQQLSGEGSASNSVWKKIKWYISLSRNALVVVIGIIITFSLNISNFGEPITVIGEIDSGLPKFQVPPLSTVVGNETYSFSDMVSTLGFRATAVPFVSVLEMVAIASAFSSGVSIDASQEMVALGLCNIMGSFISSMPVTASFSRGALSRASGSQTPAGGIFTGLLIILALSLLTSTFYFIPKSTLAAMIITAMYSMMNFQIFGKLWKKSKEELFVMLLTMAVCLFQGLEYGILTGVTVQALMLLYSHSKPSVEVSTITNEKENITLVKLSDSLSYCAADHVRRMIFRASKLASSSSMIVLDGAHINRIDFTIAINIMTVVKDLEKKEFQIVFSNFNSNIKDMFISIYPESENKFVTASNATEQPIPQHQITMI